MKVFIVFAHPERRSLNGSLLDATVSYLESEGHTVQVSDLYRMHWKTNVDRDDFPDLEPDERLRVGAASAATTLAGHLTEDVKAEQEKLLWADFVILQFPLWWFTMPAILKGWVERVLTSKFAYNVGEHNETRWGDRYGEGVMHGKRAMLVVTVGGRPVHYSARGISGPIDDVLFPITHGVLFYPGFTVLPSFVVYRADKYTEDQFETLASELRARLQDIGSTEPIRYREQNFGDYIHPDLTLRPGLEQPGTSGFRLHVKSNNQ